MVSVNSFFPAVGAVALAGGDLDRLCFFSVFSFSVVVFSAIDFSLLCSEDREDFLEEEEEARGVGRASVASDGGAG